MTRIHFLIILFASAILEANSDFDESTCGHQQQLQVQSREKPQYHSLIRQRTKSAPPAERTIVEWPWHAAVFHRIPGSTNDFDYQCGATLIHPNQVLTAAHCVTQRSTSRRRLARVDVLVKIGQFGVSQQRSQEQELEHRVSKITIHRDYDPERFENDIAAVELEVPVIVTAHVQPICLWDLHDRMDIRGRVGAVVGQRRLMENDTFALSRSDVPVGRLVQCSQRSFVKMLCVEFKNDANVCNGDSGGGMYFKNEEQWYLGGVISFFNHVEDEETCEVVFTDVSLYLDWINVHEEPISEPTNEEPINELTGEEPINEPTGEEPIIEQTGEKPEETDKEPISEQTGEELINEQTGEELISKPTNEEPISEQTSEEPINEQIGEEPISEETDEEPISELTSEEPISEPTGEEPISKPTSEEPSSEQTDEEPINEQTGEEPISEPTGIVSSDPQTDGLINQDDCGTNGYPFDYDEELKAVIQQYPWMVILQLSTIYAPCSGVLINRNYILTADCFNLFPINLTVTLGDYRVFQERDCYPRNGDLNFCLGPPQITTIVEYFRNDDGLVLARLAEPAGFSDHIRPICLPKVEPAEESNYILTGWKYFGSSAQFLQRTMVDSMPEEECRISTGGSNTTICVRNIDLMAGSMRCNLYKPGAALQAVEPKRNRYTLYGIQSGLVRCSQPSRFVDVAKYVDWIVNKMRP